MTFETLSYISKTNGIGGSIKNSPEDFLVEEIIPDGRVLELDSEFQEKDEEGEFTRFVLQKKEWTTEGAVRRIARALKTGKKRFNYAGNKDKIAVSTQLVSAFGIEKEKLLSLDLKDIMINGVWSAKEKIKLGELLGNRFTITVRDAENSENAQKIDEELQGKFPNYFGEQRFGTSRKNTHIIGEQILRGRYDKAAMIFLADSSGEINEDSKNARKNLADSEDFSVALKEFPVYLRLERSMLEKLSKNPNDFVGAMRALPRGTLLMFVHAYQSFLFNRMLSDRIAEGKIEKEEGEYFCGGNDYGFPDMDKFSKNLYCSEISNFRNIENKQEKGWLVGKLIGYETELNEREKKLLEELDMRKNDFKVKGIPELSSKGHYRTLFSPLKDFSFKDNIFRFSLPSGSYATVALREFLEVKRHD